MDSTMEAARLVCADRAQCLLFRPSGAELNSKSLLKRRQRAAGPTVLADLDHGSLYDSSVKLVERLQRAVQGRESWPVPVLPSVTQAWARPGARAHGGQIVTARLAAQVLRHGHPFKATGCQKIRKRTAFSKANFPRSCLLSSSSISCPLKSSKGLLESVNAGSAALCSQLSGQTG